MLVQYTPIASLSAAEQARLKQSLQMGLASCDEAVSHGYVVFEGKAIQLSEANKLLQPSRRQTLLG